jgi:aldose 1-epimerase
MTAPPSGEQVTLRHGEQRATVVEVGGGVREYHVGDRPVLHPYDRDAMCDGAHGTPLLPWPNRLADGQYTFDGVDYQLALTEPDKGTAIHGLVRWQAWQPRERSDDRVVMATRLAPQTGYPFALDASVDYRLGPDGLTVRTTVTNTGSRTAPVGSGQHPYLSPGDGSTVDDCVLHLDAATRILTDDARQLPVGRAAVTGTPYDFRAGRRIGELEVDHAFTDLGRDADGLAWLRLQRPDGATAALWVDESYPFVEVYTADTLAPPRRRRGLGAEPMTCAANALRTGEGLLRLEPGASMTATWGVRLE